MIYIDDIDGIVVSTNSVCNPLYDTYKNMWQLCSYRYFVRSDQGIANIKVCFTISDAARRNSGKWGNMSCLSPDPLVKCGHWVIRPLDARVEINLQWWYFWPLPISCNVPGWAYPLAKVPVWCMRWAIVRRPPGWDLSRHRKCEKTTRKLGWFRQWHMIFRLLDGVWRYQPDIHETHGTGWKRQRVFPEAEQGGFGTTWKLIPAPHWRVLGSVFWFRVGLIRCDDFRCVFSFPSWLRKIHLPIRSDFGMGWSRKPEMIPTFDKPGSPAQDKVDPLATLPQSGWIWAGMCEDSSCQNWMNMVKAKAYVVFNEAISYILHDFTVSN